MAGGWTLSEEDCTRLYVLAELLAAHSPDKLRVQVDLVPVSALPDARAQFALLNPALNAETLSDAVNPLVIDEQGRCLPFSYGIDVRLELANVLSVDTHDVFRPRPDSMRSIATLLDRAFETAEADGAAFIDWFAHLTRVSREFFENAGVAGAQASAPPLSQHLARS
jgi:hypothetical protein